MKRVRAAVWTLIAAVGVLALVASPARSQAQTGNLYGTTVDEQGAALEGVTVTLTGGGTSQARTNQEGQFRFLGLAPGTYALRAELEGYSTVDYPNIVISVNRNTSIEVTLSAAIEETIGDPGR